MSVVFLGWQRREMHAMVSSLIHVPIVAVILRFDGSLRGVNTCDTAASCASALLRNNDQPIAVGGRSISVLPNLSSGEAEYHGLILGLEFLEEWIHHSATSGKLDNLIEEENDDGGDGDSKACAITILGDCKTVIDHLNGVAAPRKLKQKYDEAVSHIVEIKKHLRETFGRNFHITFTHVPRRDNVLCDALCGIVMSYQKKQLLSKMEHAITEGRLKSVDSTKKFLLPKSKKSRFNFRKTHFAHAISTCSSLPID